MSYTILSFNMRNVGGGALMNRDWSTVADIMRDTRADIVAVQEVFSELPFKWLCQRLNVTSSATGGIGVFRGKLAETDEARDMRFYGTRSALTFRRLRRMDAQSAYMSRRFARSGADRLCVRRA